MSFTAFSVEVGLFTFWQNNCIITLVPPVSQDWSSMLMMLAYDCFTRILLSVCVADNSFCILVMSFKHNVGGIKVEAGCVIENAVTLVWIVMKCDIDDSLADLFYAVACIYPSNTRCYCIW